MDLQRANFSVYWTPRGPISSFIGLPESQFLRFLSLCTGNEPHARSGVCLPVRRRGKSDGSYGPLRGAGAALAVPPKGRDSIPDAAHITPATSPPVGYTTNARDPGYAVYIAGPCRTCRPGGATSAPIILCGEASWAALTAPKAPSGCVGHA